MQTKFLIVISIVFATIATVSSCSIYNDYEASRPEKVRETETLLEQATFRKVNIETPDQHGAAAELPLRQLNRYQSAGGNVYWYADPDLCGCLYEGDQKAYDRYADLLQQQKDTAEYVNDVGSDQVVMLSPFGNAFPPPLILGAWPIVIIEHGGGFHGGGHHGGGHGHGGGGHGHGGGGGGHGHGGGGGHR